MEIILFILALAVVFAVKAVAISRYSEDEAAKSVSFSWVAPEAHADAAPAWNQPERRRSEAVPARAHVSVLRHPKAA